MRSRRSTRRSAKRSPRRPFSKRSTKRSARVPKRSKRSKWARPRRFRGLQQARYTKEMGAIALKDEFDKVEDPVSNIILDPDIGLPSLDYSIVKIMVTRRSTKNNTYKIYLFPDETAAQDLDPEPDLKKYHLTYGDFNKTIESDLQRIESANFGRLNRYEKYYTVQKIDVKRFQGEETFKSVSGLGKEARKKVFGFIEEFKIKSIFEDRLYAQFPPSLNPLEVPSMFSQKMPPPEPAE